MHEDLFETDKSLHNKLVVTPNRTVMGLDGVGTEPACFRNTHLDVQFFDHLMLCHPSIKYTVTELHWQPAGDLQLRAHILNIELSNGLHVVLRFEHG